MPDELPLAFFFLGTVALILITNEVGFVFGKRAARRAKANSDKAGRENEGSEKDGPSGTTAGAVLGLAAFILAFAFGIVASRLDSRKQLVRDDANTIGTAWLRTDFLPEPEGTEARAILREYLEVRLDLAVSHDASKVPAALARTQELQDRIWAIVVANGKKNLNSDVGALLIEAVNEMIDLHTVRTAVAIDARIPVGIWAILFLLTALGMLTVGYTTGLSGSARLRTGMVLAVAFSIVITLIAVLDRPTSKYGGVSQKPLTDLLETMKARPAAPTAPSPQGSPPSSPTAPPAPAPSAH